MTREEFLAKAPALFGQFKKSYPAIYFQIKATRGGHTLFQISRNDEHQVEMSSENLLSILQTAFDFSPAEVELKFFSSQVGGQPIGTLRFEEQKGNALGSINTTSGAVSVEEITAKIRQNFEMERLKKENAELTEKLKNFEEKAKSLAGVDDDNKGLRDENASLREDLEKAKSSFEKFKGAGGAGMAALGEKFLGSGLLDKFFGANVGQALAGVQTENEATQTPIKSTEEEQILEEIVGEIADRNAEDLRAIQNHIRELIK